MLLNNNIAEMGLKRFFSSHWLTFCSLHFEQRAAGGGGGGNGRAGRDGDGTRIG